MTKINRILIIRFRRVGDAILSSILCSSLKRTFPEATIDYVLNEEISSLFTHHPDIDNIISFSKDELKSTFTYAKKVKKIMKEGQYDIIIDTRSTIRTSLFSLFSPKTPYKIGRKKSYNIFHNYTVNNHFLEYNPDNGPSENIIDLTLKLLKPLEKDFSITYDRKFQLYITEEEKKKYANYLLQKKVDLSKPIIICAIATRLTYKMWNKKNMADILQKILSYNEDVQLIFNYGGAKEKNIAKQIHEEMHYHPRVFSDIDANNLRELAVLVSLSKSFFGYEGGPRHIAQALDIPAFAIYPPGVGKQRWLPNPSHAYQGIEAEEISRELAESDISYQEKISLITVEEVWNRLAPMLAQYIV